MKFRTAILAIGIVLFFIPASSHAQAPAKPDRQVAITIDALPAGMSDRLPAAAITAITATAAL